MAKEKKYVKAEICDTWTKIGIWKTIIKNNKK